MILAQLNWRITAALAWIIFGGWILAIEFIELQRERKAILGYRHTKKGRRRTDYLFIAFGVWVFGIAMLIV